MTSAKCEMKPGERFDFGGINWTVLAPDCEGGVFAIASEIRGENMKFSKDACNDYRKSNVREALHQLESALGGENLIPHTVDLTADNGSKEYGTVQDKVFLITCDEYRKYRDHIPRYDDWVWTCTPWRSPVTGIAISVRSVITDGTLNLDYAYSSGGVVPACIFNPESLAPKGVSGAMDEMLKELAEELPETEMLAQLAEEASELAQAALKIRRTLDDVNPTPIGYVQALENLAEEIADVKLCEEVLYAKDVTIRGAAESSTETMRSKAERWVQRLKER